MPIKTNHIKYELNRDIISERYDIFSVSTSEKYIKSGALVLDTPSLNKAVCSVCFESGKMFYVLLPHEDGNRVKFKELFNGIDGCDNLTCKQESIQKIASNILLQLLLNSINNYNSPLLKFNNLTGHLYCFHPNWLVHGKKESTDVIWKVPCLEIRVNSNDRMTLAVRTFSSVLLKKKMAFTKKKFEDYPQYVFSAKQTLRRKLKNDVSEAFILRQTENVKTEIPFMDMQTIERFNCSKMGVLAQIVDIFNKNFSYVAKIDFDSITDYIDLDYSTHAAREDKKSIIALLQKKPIRIVDSIGNTDSVEYCKNIQILLKDKYGKEAKISKKVTDDALNIRLIHNEAYYNDERDPHDKRFTNSAVQHITFEDFSDSSEFAIATIINELLIKQNIIDEKISLFDWERLNFSGDVIFGQKIKVEDVDRYFFITVHKDGRFEINEQMLNLFEMDKYSKCVEIFEGDKDNSESIKGIIIDDKNNVNIIRDTGWITIPEIASIRSELMLGNNKLRGELKRQELFSSILDIKMFKVCGILYYFVGVIGAGMRYNVCHAANIRKIEGYGESELFFEKLLPLMSVTFVRNGQLTILPFPFKYLQEYLRASFEKNR